MVSLNEIGTEPEKPKQCPCKCGKGIAVFLVLFLLAGIACWYIHHPNRPRYINPEMDLKPGTICTVQFRRDALGTAKDLPVSPTTNSINGAIVSMRGELIAINHDVILLDQVNNHYIVNDVPQMKRFWIPKSSILSIEYEPARTFLDLPQDNILRIEYEALRNIEQRRINSHAD